MKKNQHKFLQILGLMLVLLSIFMTGCQSTHSIDGSTNTPENASVESQVENQKNIIQHMQRAQSYYNQGQWQSAYDAYQHLNNLMPDDPFTFFRLGNISLRLNKPQDALSYYEQSIQLNNHFIEAHNNLALAHLILAEQAFANIEMMLKQKKQEQEAGQSIQEKRMLIERLLETPVQEQSVIR